MTKLHALLLMGGMVGLAACGGGNESLSEESAAPEPMIEEASIAETPPVEIEAAPVEISAEQQAIANAQINLAALSAYRDHAEQFKQKTGSYPLTKRNFRSALGAFQDAENALAEDGEAEVLELPEGAAMDKPGRIVYRSDGSDYKVIAQRTGDCSIVRGSNPELIDPKRDYGPGDCIAYGYWTDGAESW